MSDMENLRTLLAFKGQYHNHKENLAHASIAIQLGILAAIVTIKPSEGIANCYKDYFIGCYFFVWLIITGYAIWQLAKRHKVANQIGKIIEVFEKEAKKQYIAEIISELGGGAKGLGFIYVLLGIADVSILSISWIWIEKIW